MTPLDHALSYTTKGWPVFHCRAADEETIDPRTGEIGALTAKSPYPSNGLKGATVFDHIVKRWWSDHPDAMIGIPTGTRTGVWVLDVDVANGKPGEATLAALEAANDNLPPTRQAKTGSGGRHYYFKHHDGVRNRGALGAGLDVRGEGGYVVAPGSVLADGRTYKWLNDNDILPAPQWLLDLVITKSAPAATYNHIPLTGDNSAYVEAAIDDELSGLAGTPQGARNNALNDAAFALGQFVGAGALPLDDATARLESVALQWPNPKLSRGTIKRGLEAGQKQPRQIPESTYRDDVMAMDFSKLIANAKRRVGGSDGAQGAENAADDVATEPATVAETETAEPTKEPADRTPHATPFEWIDPSDLPRREFIFGTHLIRKYVSVTVSPGGIGKTSLAIAETLSMVSGKQLLETKPVGKLNVWVVNSEDPRDEMQRRIMAGAKYYNLKPSDLNGLFMDTGREQDYVIAFDERGGVRIARPIVEAVIEHISRNKIDVMIVDPFVSTHQVNENDNNAIDRVAKLWAKIADETNCAIEIVHHVRKSDGREVTVEDGRGAGALLAASRSARVLNRMSEEQANAAGLQMGDRFFHFYVTRGKSNMAMMSGGLEWYKMESVALGNGRGLQKPQDHVGVVTKWEWPSDESVIEGLGDDVRQRIISIIRNGEFLRATQSKEAWAGLAVAQALGLDTDDAKQKKRAESILRAMLKNGDLIVEDGTNPSSRKIAKMVRAA